MEFSRQFDSLAVSWAELFRGESGQAARNDNLQLSPEISVTSIPPTPGLLSPAPALATPAPVYTPDNMITAMLPSRDITLALMQLHIAQTIIENYHSEVGD